MTAPSDIYPWPTITSSLALAAVAILLFILKVLPARREDRNQYLIILLICLFSHLVGGLLMISGVLNLGVYAIVSLSLVVLYGPSFYYYVRKLLNLKAEDFLWQLILLELGLWVLIALQAQAVLKMPHWIYNLYYSAILLSYFLAALKIRRSHRLKKGHKWMNTLLVVFGGLIVLYLMESVWMSLDFGEVHSIVLFCSTVYNVFCFIFLLIAIRQIITSPGLFSDMNIRIPYKFLKAGDHEDELNLLRSYVVFQKQYKNPDLNRNLVSKATGLGVHRISELINIGFRKNFNDWINDYRIEEAKRYLTHSHLSIKEICFEVGFNSKSVFNTAFKKRIRQTPTEYRQENG